MVNRERDGRKVINIVSLRPRSRDQSSAVPKSDELEIRRVLAVCLRGSSNLFTSHANELFSLSTGDQLLILVVEIKGVGWQVISSEILLRVFPYRWEISTRGFPTMATWHLRSVEKVRRICGKWTFLAESTRTEAVCPPGWVINPAPVAASDTLKPFAIRLKAVAVEDMPSHPQPVEKRASGILGVQLKSGDLWEIRERNFLRQGLPDFFLDKRKF